MATRSEANAVYAAGLVQGIVLVTFPAASTIFTDPEQYDLSGTQYGTMFLPQVITAIVASLPGGVWPVASGPSGSTGGLRAAPRRHRFPGGGLRARGARAGPLVLAPLFDSVGRRILLAVSAWLIGTGSSRTGLFIGYLVGAAIMVLGGVVELLIGINAEGKSLEAVTKPLTAAAE